MRIVLYLPYRINAVYTPTRIPQNVGGKVELEENFMASVVPQQVKPPPAMPASPMSAVPSTLLPRQLSASVPRKAKEDGPRHWTCATYVGDLNEVLGSWIWSDPLLVVVNIWGVNQLMEDICIIL